MYEYIQNEVYVGVDIYQNGLSGYFWKVENYRQS